MVRRLIEAGALLAATAIGAAGMHFGPKMFVKKAKADKGKKKSDKE